MNCVGELIVQKTLSWVRDHLLISPYCATQCHKCFAILPIFVRNTGCSFSVYTANTLKILKWHIIGSYFYKNKDHTATRLLWNFEEIIKHGKVGRVFSSFWTTLAIISHPLFISLLLNINQPLFWAFRRRSLFDSQISVYSMCSRICESLGVGPH